jgi:hypothetical protein
MVRHLDQIGFSFCHDRIQFEVSRNAKDLGLTGSSANDAARTLAEHRSRQGRYMRDRSSGRIRRRLSLAPPRDQSQSRHSLFGLSAHCFRAVRNGGNGHPSFLARSRMTTFLRRNAAEARTIDAPCATSAFRRSSSSAVHG